MVNRYFYDGKKIPPYQYKVAMWETEGRVSMKKKRICALLLTVAMTAGTLAGCGGDSGSGSTETGSAATEEGSSDSASGDVIELTFFNADANQDDPWTDPEIGRAHV